jgi:hypothetical protein
MNNLSFTANIQEKIYQIISNPNNDFLTIVSYFPFSEDDKQLIFNLNKSKPLIEFRSIFSDNVTEQEWNESKKQIINRFQDELIDIDKM